MPIVSDVSSMLTRGVVVVVDGGGNINKPVKLTDLGGEGHPKIDTPLTPSSCFAPWAGEECDGVMVSLFGPGREERETGEGVEIVESWKSEGGSDQRSASTFTCFSHTKNQLSAGVRCLAAKGKRARKGKKKKKEGVCSFAA